MRPIALPLTLIALFLFSLPIIRLVRQRRKPKGTAARLADAEEEASLAQG
jgi:hypothetical protein